VSPIAVRITDENGEPGLGVLLGRRILATLYDAAAHITKKSARSSSGPNSHIRRSDMSTTGTEPLLSV